ncbi:MAG: hypothetical protein H6622_06470 [Halobacteriovoraceae bacterium]|nr:hypothetical protein [Halobacteriovoraceae bacterium]
MDRCVICNQKMEADERVYPCKDMVLFKDGHSHIECARVELARPYSLFVIDEDPRIFELKKFISK